MRNGRGRRSLGRSRATRDVTESYIAAAPGVAICPNAFTAALSHLLCAPHFMLYFSMKVPRTVPEFRRWLQAEIATLGRWIDDPEVQENLFTDAAGMIRNAQRLAIALEQPAIAAICERVTTPALALPVAQRVLTECLNALQNDSLTSQ